MPTDSPQPRRAPGAERGPSIVAGPTIAGRNRLVRRFLGWIVLLLVWGSAAQALDLRLRTGNDAGVTDDDDFYTFAVSFQLERGPYALRFRENAFTDRQARIRFDETHLSVGRWIPGTGPWSVYGELGLVHVGEGLFGESAQNALHDLLGGEELDLPYGASHQFGRLEVVADRWRRGPVGAEWGPRLEVEAIPGLRSHLVVAAQATWRSRTGLLTLYGLAGGRLTDAAHPALEPHLHRAAGALRAGVVVRDRLALEWSYNDFGDRRQHLSIGYRVGTPARASAPGRREDVDIETTSRRLSR